MNLPLDSWIWIFKNIQIQLPKDRFIYLLIFYNIETNQKYVLCYWRPYLKYF